MAVGLLFLPGQRRREHGIAGACAPEVPMADHAAIIYQTGEGHTTSPTASPPKAGRGRLRPRHPRGGGGSRQLDGFDAVLVGGLVQWGVRKALGAWTATMRSASALPNGFFSVSMTAAVQ
jgi:hypothetical protein